MTITDTELKSLLNTLKTVHGHRSNNYFYLNIFSYLLGLIHGREVDGYGNRKRITGIDREILEDKLLDNIAAFCRTEKERIEYYNPGQGKKWTFETGIIG